MVTLHFAAHDDRLAVCELLMAPLRNKNPATINGWTPLHVAAEMDHSKVYELIMKSLENKNPEKVDGKTPLHLAARNGHKDRTVGRSENLGVPVIIRWA